MKIIRKKKDSTDTSTVDSSQLKTTTPKQKLAPWKILIVDDEIDIHTMTRLALKNFEFAGKKLEILKAMSGKEAREILKNESDIAVAFVDVVMETDDAGLLLIDFIRNDIKIFLIRLIIRTGQPGMAPEKEVIERYDIDDYKEKTELTAQKLYTTMRVALKSFNDLSTLDNNRKALKKIIDAVPGLYHLQSLKEFFNQALTQMIGLCNLGEHGVMHPIANGFIVTFQEQIINIQATSGHFIESDDTEDLVKTCLLQVLGKESNDNLPEHALLLPLMRQEYPIGFIYLEEAAYLDHNAQSMLHIMTLQCAAALENIQLFLDLQQANQKTLDMLTATDTTAQLNMQSLTEIYKLAVPHLAT